LLDVGRLHLVESDPAGDRDRFRAGPHRPGDEAWPGGGRGGICRLARQARCGGVDVVHLVGQAVLTEHDARAPEGVGLDDVRAGLQVARVDRLDDVRAREHQVLVAAFERRPAEVVRGQIPALDGGAHRAVEDEDAFRQGGAQRVGAIGGRHGCLSLAYPRR